MKKLVLILALLAFVVTSCESMFDGGRSKYFLGKDNIWLADPTMHCTMSECMTSYRLDKTSFKKIAVVFGGPYVEKHAKIFFNEEEVRSVFIADERSVNRVYYFTLDPKLEVQNFRIEVGKKKIYLSIKTEFY